MINDVKKPGLESRRYITENPEEKTRSEYLIYSDGSGKKISKGVNTRYERMRHISQEDARNIRMEIRTIGTKVGAIDNIFSTEEFRENKGGIIIHYDPSDRKTLGVSHPVVNVEPPYEKIKAPAKSQTKPLPPKPASQPPCRSVPLGKIVAGMQEQYNKEGREQEKGKSNK